MLLVPSFGMAFITSTVGWRGRDGCLVHIMTSIMLTTAGEIPAPEPISMASQQCEGEKANYAGARAINISLVLTRNTYSQSNNICFRVDFGSAVDFALKEFFFYWWCVVVIGNIWDLFPGNMVRFFSNYSRQISLFGSSACCAHNVFMAT